MNARNDDFSRAISDQIISISELPLHALFQACADRVEHGKPEEALICYETWLRESADPNRFLAWYNYGSLLQAQGKSSEAIDAYRQCLSIQPFFPQALINLGLILERLGRREEALRQWVNLVSQRYLKSPPDPDLIVVALNHIGRVQEELKQYDLAEKALEESLALKPRQKGALQHWIHIRQKACKWPVYKDLPNITKNEMLMATSPLAMLALTDDPVQQLLTAHAFVERTYSFKEEFLCHGRSYTHDRARVGFVSGDLCVHAVGLLLAELIENQDRNRFEVYGYDYSPEDGTAHRERLKNAFDHLRFIHKLNDRQVAELILSDEIDILIDLHGLSSGARPGIFSLHPAPRQGTYLGFIGTTAMPWFDFVVADKYVIPEELTTYFTEKPLYVDGCFIPVVNEQKTYLTVKRSDLGIPDDAFVMAALGNVYKITEAMFSTWLRIMEKLPNAFLWLIDDNETTTRNLQQFARNFGANLTRIIFSKRCDLAQYKARLSLADVFLDTFPYNCGSTAKDVLEAQVPLVTLSGRTMVSRMGGSMIHSLGLDDLLIANSFDSYIEKTLFVANNQNLVLTALKQSQHKRWSIPL